MDEDENETHDRPYFGPRGPTAAETEAMDNDGEQGGAFNADETFDAGGDDGAAFEHRTFVPLFNEIPTPEVLKADGSKTSGADQTKEPPPEEQKKKSKTAKNAHHKDTKRARLQKPSPDRVSSETSASSAGKTPATPVHTATSEASTSPKTPTATVSESHRGTQRREAAAIAERRIHEGASKATAVEIRDSDEE